MTATPKCAVCADAGKPADHRAGGKACPHVRGRINIPIRRAEPEANAKGGAPVRAANKTPRPRAEGPEEEEGRNGSMRKKREEEDKGKRTRSQPTANTGVGELREVEMRLNEVPGPELGTSKEVEEQSEGRGGEEDPILNN